MDAQMSTDNSLERLQAAAKAAAAAAADMFTVTVTVVASTAVQTEDSTQPYESRSKRASIRKKATCVHCSGAFRDFASLRKHLLQKHEDKFPFRCDVCGLGFPSSSRLVGHMRAHSSKRHFPCKECGATYKSKPQLVLHKKTHTRLFESSKYVGPFSEEACLADPNEEKAFKCAACGMAFRELGALASHVSIHIDANPCVECGKATDQPPRVAVRSGTTSGQSPYTCAECSYGISLYQGESFSPPDDLHRVLAACLLGLRQTPHAVEMSH